MKKIIAISWTISGILGWLFAATMVFAQPDYSFTPLAFIGDMAPGGGVYTADFEPWGLNNRGEGVFVSDLVTGGEGIFMVNMGALSLILQPGQPAPGGGAYYLNLGRTAISDSGDVSFAFTLNPSGIDFPIGINSGVYRFSHITKEITAVIVPGVTPAPGGGTFAGTYYNTSITNRGELLFSGMVPATIGPGASVNLGIGLFKADKKGRITSVVRPGDPSPEGGTFDFATNGWINDRGDIAFGAHLAGEECITLGQVLPAYIFCAESVYVKDGTTAGIQSIAHQGDPAPGGGIYRLAFGPVMNSRGDIVFVGDLTPTPNFGEALAVFLFSGGTTIPVARPGDPMPGGGKFVTGPFYVGNYYLNNSGDVSFSATLDTDDNGDGIPDTGLYVFSRGSVRLVARTGTEIPGVGTIAHMSAPVFVGASYPFPWATINDRGQVFFQAVLTDGRGALLLATPSP